MTVETPSGKSASDENFPVGSALIRADLRPHIHAFYSFARQADDIADNKALEPADKVRRLEIMGAVLDGTQPDESSPSATAMRASLAATGMDAVHCHDLLRAFRQDATKLRYADWSELMEYCRYSASPVGRQVLDLHGEARDTWPSNDALCSALQVLNHLQDCGKDRRDLDRVYVTHDAMAAEGAQLSDLDRPALTPGMRRVLDRLLDLTDSLIERSRPLPRLVTDRRLQCETAIIVRLAAKLSARLRRQDPLAGRVKLTPLDFLLATLGGVAEGLTKGGSARADDADAREVDERVRASGTSFYAAMRLLPARRRSAMYAVYAFCREVDDIADEDGEPAAKLAALATWRREIDALYAGRPTNVVTRALLEPVRRYRLRREDFIAVIDGMEMDARPVAMPMSMAELDLYCARVASAVGRLSVRVFGAMEPIADQVAESLGRALQLTNILRDLVEDADRGRLYLPRELLDAHGIATTDPKQVLRHPALPQVCAALAEIADRHFADARAAMRFCPHRAMRPAAIMAATYGEIFRRLRQRGWQALDVRPRVPGWMKLWIVMRYGLI